MKAKRWTAFAAATLFALALPAGARRVETAWWNVNFESPVPAVSNEYDAVIAGGFELENGALGPLTNNGSKVDVLPPYSTGLWLWEDGDESYVTNVVYTNGVGEVLSNNWQLVLNTQAHDLTWTNTVGVLDPGKIFLVDADLRLVGSDTPPDPKEFDSTNDVQAAIFLRNYTGEDGDVTNSVLCVYSKVGSANVWQELEGVEIEDGSWHHVAVQMDYSSGSAKIQVFVDGTTLRLRGGTKDSFDAANQGTANAAHSVSSVSFRGTGAVDNFAGTEVTYETESLTYIAEVWIDDVLQPFGTRNNTSRIKADVATGENLFVAFNEFLVTDGNYTYYVPQGEHYALKKAEISNFAEKTTNTTTFTRAEYGQIVADSECTEIVFQRETTTGLNLQKGPFDVSIATDGATEPTNVAVRLYFQTIGSFNAIAEKVLGGNTTTNAYFLKPENMPLTTNWTFNAVDGGNLLSSIQLFNGATLAYADGVATVEVSFANPCAFSNDTKFVTATYTAGELPEGWTLTPTQSDGTWTFTPTEPATTHTIVFNTNGVEYVTVSGVEDGATDYAPADPVLANAEFMGWTNKVDGGAAFFATNAPAATGDATYTAIFQPRANPGDGLAEYNAAHPLAPVKPIDFVASAQDPSNTNLCAVSFVAPLDGDYVLLTNSTLTAEFAEDEGSTQTVSAGELVRLTESEPSPTSKFFKIGWKESQPQP